MIKINKVSLKIGRRTVLNNISGEIEKGDFIILKGKDDSGKTSFLKILAGMIVDYSGEVYVFGKKMDYESAAAAERIFYVPDDLIDSKWMTVRDYFEWTKERSEFYSDYIEASLLGRFEIRRTDSLSELDEDSNKCVQLIAAVSSGADVLLLDEPDNFLCDENAQKWNRIFEAMSIGGKTFIISACGDPLFCVKNSIIWTISGGKLG